MYIEEDDNLDKIILSYQSPWNNAYTVLDSDTDDWPSLLTEFALVLNEAGFSIPIGELEIKLNTLLQEYSASVTTQEDEMYDFFKD